MGKNILAPFFSIETTLSCNLKCVMCSNPKENRSMPLAAEQIKEMLSCADSLIPDVIFTGGEPTIDPLLPEYLACLSEDTRITILTNGTTLGNNFVKEHILPRTYELRISLDDMPNKQHSHQRIGSNPQKIFRDLISIRKEFPDMQMIITTVLNSELLQHLEKFYNIVTSKGVGINGLRLIPQIYYKGRAPEAITKNKWQPLNFDTIGEKSALLIQKYLDRTREFDFDIQHLFSSITLEGDYVIETFRNEENPCQYQDGLFVTNQGNVVLCPNSTLNVANIDDFTDIQKFIKYRFRSDIIADHPFRKLKGVDKPYCVDCRYRGLCGFGCPATSQSLTGDATLPDPIKCSFANIWERDILPILPTYLQEKFYEAINYDGLFPHKFKNIAEIIKFNKARN